MTAPERETAGTVRSAHLAYFLPPDWGRIARIAGPALARLPRDAEGPGLLAIVPDAAAALALTRALAAVPGAAGHRLVAVTSAARGKRLLAGPPASVVVGAPIALAPLLASSVLKLDRIATVLFASADELDADDADLAALLTEIPRAAARLLTALQPTPSVEQLLERHLHKARRVTEDAAPAAGTETATALRYLAVTGSPVEALPSVLDEADAPSATIITADPDLEAAARALLGSIGYGDGALARFSAGPVEPNTALVVFVGVPTGSLWSTAVAAHPAQLVAIVTPRDRAALELLAAPSPVRPFVARGTISRARATEARARTELRDVLAEGLPAREILSLEPLLVDHDGLEVAAAALRLLDRTRASQAELVRETEKRVRAEIAASQVSVDPAPAPRARDESPRGDRPRPFAGKGDRPREFAPRGDKPRSFGSREGRDFTPRGAPPRGAGRDAERPRGPRREDDRPRGPRRDDDRPRGPRRDDGPRGPRRDDDRPRGPKGPR